jgi:TonB family protein
MTMDRMRRNTTMDIIKTIAAALLLAAVPAHAAKLSADVPVEMGMRVEGTLAIGGDGRITALEIDKQDALPDAVAALVRNTVQQWQFEPSVRDGVPVSMDTRMTVRVVARPGANETFNVRLVSAHFEPAKSDAERAADIRGRTLPPRYPAEVFRNGGQGTVYLALKVDEEGRVIDRIAEQVNLRSAGTPRQMEAFRSGLAKASLEAARKWRFPQSAGDAALGQPYRTLRVPVTFAINQTPADDLGHWRAYIPGPRSRIPWVTGADSAGFSPDLLTDGTATLADDPNAPRLLTPLSG